MTEEQLQWIQGTVDECPVTMYWVYVEYAGAEPELRNYDFASYKLPETVQKKNCYETSIYQKQKKDFYTTSLPDIEEQEVDAKDLPDWATYRCTPVMRDNNLVFIKSDRGPVRLPKAYTEDFLTLILDKECVITTLFEWKHE